MGGAPTTRGPLWPGGNLIQRGLSHEEVFIEGAKNEETTHFPKGSFLGDSGHRGTGASPEVEKYIAIGSRCSQTRGAHRKPGSRRNLQSTPCLGEAERTSLRTREGRDFLRSHSQSVVEPQGLGSPGPDSCPAPRTEGLLDKAQDLGRAPAGSSQVLRPWA